MGATHRNGVDGACDSQGDEYLTIAEVAELLKLSPKRVRNLISAGVFLPGVHFFRRRGITPRFLRSRVDAWIRGDEGVPQAAIPMARDHRRPGLRRPREVA
jgi:hypothetical protein